MQYKLLRWLCCPSCSGELLPEAFESDADEMWQGLLECVCCSARFPVIDGIPRMLVGEMQADLQQHYPGFFQRFGDQYQHQRVDVTDPDLHKKRQIQSRFAYEWTQFDDYDCDNFADFIAPLPTGFFSGKLGLDIGCGAGRHAGAVAGQQGEVVGVDLSQAVDAAYRNNKGNSKVHIVQADVYHLPFKKQQFDFIYSIGVLHHLPSPEEGFQLLPAYLKPDGSLFVWLYAYTLRKRLLESLRMVSQSLSNENIHRMAWLCNLIDYGVFINAYKLLATLPVLGGGVERLAPARVVEYAEHGYQVALTDWYDRLSAPLTNYYKQVEMQAWLDHSTMKNRQLLAIGDSWWWLYGEVK